MAKVITLVAAGAAVAAGASKAVTLPVGKENIPVVISGTFVGTVSIDGSVDNTNWVSLTSKTAPFAGLVPAFPYMRSNITAWTSGAITAKLSADQAFGA